MHIHGHRSISGVIDAIDINRREVYVKYEGALVQCKFEAKSKIKDFTVGDEVFVSGDGIILEGHIIRIYARMAYKL